MGRPAATAFAGVGRRIAAYLVDSLIVGVADILLTVVFDAVFGPLVAATPDGAALQVIAVNPLRVVLELTATLIIDAAYFAGCWSRWGATPAQLALGLRIRLAESAQASSASPAALPIETAWRRWAVLAVFPIAVGSLAASGALDAGVLVVANGTWFLILLMSTMADPLRRGLHDRAAGTVVVAAPNRTR